MRLKRHKHWLVSSLVLIRHFKQNLSFHMVGIKYKQIISSRLTTAMTDGLSGCHSNISD